MAEFKHIVRVCNTDLKGEKAILYALTKIKGVNVMYANMALSISGIDKTRKAGELSETEVSKIDEILKSPAKYHVPTWMFNRRQDYETGDDKHLLGSDLTLEKDNDIKRMKKVKTYKGLRHQWGLTVRGQRTKSNFRKNKGKGLVAKKKTLLRK